MDPATALPLAPPQRKTTSSAESESSSAHDEDDLSLASGWSDEERASQGDGQPRVNDKSPTIDNDVQDSLLVVSTSATDVETLRCPYKHLHLNHDAFNPTIRWVFMSPETILLMKLHGPCIL